MNSDQTSDASLELALQKLNGELARVETRTRSTLWQLLSLFIGALVGAGILGNLADSSSGSVYRAWYAGAWAFAGAAALAAAVAGVLYWRLRNVRGRLRSDVRRLEKRLRVADGDDSDRTLASLDNPIPPDGLVRACAAQDCVLFAGMGIGAQAGYPTWSEAISEVLNTADKQRLWDAAESEASLESGRFSVAIRELFRAGDNVAVADLIATRLSRESLREILARLYSMPRAMPSQLASALQTIGFASVVTANWSYVVEAVFEGSQETDQIVAPQEPSGLGERFRQGSFSVIRLSGDLSRNDTFTFTDSESKRTIEENPELAKFLRSLLTSRTFLFLGIGLANLAQFLADLSFTGSSAKRHYALVPWQLDIDIQSERFLSRWGVELIAFSPSDDYVEVQQFCIELAADANRAARAQSNLSASPAQPPASTLTRVVLSNIGAFNDLALEFNTDWNVILGNNGSGKSTVLKAIALGLCGDDPRVAPLASSLLRRSADAVGGYVELTVGEEVYRTDLVRSGEQVIARSRQLTRLQARTLVVVGFPSLRGASTRGASGPSSDTQSAYPVVDDVLPLLAGQVDYRVDNIRQWIVNAYFRPGADTTRNRSIVDAFFRIVAAFTPGMRLEFREVTRDYRVMVDTDDGVVPIEFLSQGTSSILGWIGTLLQRMYDVYPQSPQPELEQALVLIDEVDAHMHPEWQRTVVQTLRDQLPGVQVIATTHSPLIVPSLEPGEVTRLRRDPETKRIEPAIVSYDVRNYRTEQVLVSPLFELETSLSPMKERQLAAYSEFALRDDMTPAEDDEFKRRARDLGVAPSSSYERAEARLAYNIMQEALEQYTKALPEETRARVASELRLQLLDLVSGSRRP